MQSTSPKPERRVGRVIRQHRQAKGWNLRHLAKRAKVDLSQLSKVERGDSGTSLASYQRIAKALGLPVTELFAGLDPPRRPGQIDLSNAVGGTV